MLVSVPSLHHSSTPFFSFVSQHLLQGSIFSERLGPAEVFFEIGAGFDQILNHVIDSFVRHERGGFEQARIGLDGFFRDGRIFFAHPFRKRFLGKARVFFDQVNSRHVGAQEIRAWFWARALINARLLVTHDDG